MAVNGSTILAEVNWIYFIAIAFYIVFSIFESRQKKRRLEELAQKKREQQRLQSLERPHEREPSRPEPWQTEPVRQESQIEAYENAQSEEAEKNPTALEDLLREVLGVPDNPESDQPTTARNTQRNSPPEESRHDDERDELADEPYGLPRPIAHRYETHSPTAALIDRQKDTFAGEVRGMNTFDQMKIASLQESTDRMQRALTRSTLPQARSPLVTAVIWSEILKGPKVRQGRGLRYPFNH